ncbi:MAG: amidase family protein, partial [Firmicutes bacterium]|nr:amidase family protein [Bacillota bacterium]
MKDLIWKSAISIARLIRRREISPVEVIHTFLSRIEKVNPIVNAINTLVPDKAISAAREAEASLYRGYAALGPLHGVPVLIKDNIFTRDIKTTFGSLLYENFVPVEDAILVKRLKDAGAIVAGKTNLPEFGLVPVTDSLVSGTTFNPWDLGKTCGGSSGGSAAAVASGLSPVAMGNDAGGSIRIPASLCGVYGLKPSFGRIPRYPRLYGMDTLAHEGPITRTVSDAALMLDIMSGPDDRDRYSLPLQKGGFLKSLKAGVKGLKIAFNMDLGYVVVGREVRELIGRAVSAFSEMGASVEEVGIEFPNMEKDLRFVAVSEVIAANEGRLEEWKLKAHPFNQPLFSMAEKFTCRDIVKVQFHREELWDK